MDGPIRRLRVCSGWGPAALLAAAVLATAGCGQGRSSTPATPAGAGLRGLVPTPLPSKPSFTLTDTAGHRYSFAAKTSGKLAYLYFGYTHCPDICPLTMSDLAIAVRSQPASVRSRVTVVFVTVDPRRDSRRVLRSWLDHYDASFVGLTGNRREIATAERAAGIPLAAPERTKGADYTVQHSAIVLAYSPDNRSHVVYTEGFKAADYSHDLPLLLRF